jgi:quinoprotein glucose dehydrogenase
MTPSLSRLAAGDPKQTNFRYSGGGAGRPGQPNLATLMQIEGLSIFKPPYAKVTAIDMNKGVQVWMTPLGNGPLNHPLLKDLNLPPLGDAIERLNVLLTKTLLFVGTQRLDSLGHHVPPAWAKWGDPDMDRKLIYVFDKQTGDLLRAIELDGLSVAAPMTYMHRGKQYIVVATGAGETAEVVALSLSRTSAN